MYCTGEKSAIKWHACQYRLFIWTLETWEDETWDQLVHKPSDMNCKGASTLKLEWKTMFNLFGEGQD